MTNRLPSATITDGTLVVRFLDSAPSQSVEVKCTIDLTDFGEVTGVEVLDWRRQLLGGLLDGPSSCGGVRWSYDEEIDAFYVHLMNGRSQVQRTAAGKVSLDPGGRVVSLEIPVSLGGQITH